MHPTALEIGNCIDGNCNNLTDDYDPSINGQSNGYVDNNADGY